MKHLKSKWRSTIITPVEISKLTLIDKVQKASYNEVHHSIKNNGLYYPIACFKITVERWMKEYNDPNYTENDDGCVWAVYSGSSKLEYARLQGYDIIDCIMHSEKRDSINIDDWLSICDPLHNEKAPPLKQTKGARIDYQKDIDRKTMEAKYKNPGRK